MRRNRSSGLADASCGPSQGRSSGPLRPFGRKFIIQYSKLDTFAGHTWTFISDRVAACEGAPATQRSCGPSPPEAPARCGSLSEPQIHDSKFRIMEFGPRPAESTLEADLRDASCGPPPPPGCGPPIAVRLIPCRQARSRADGLATQRSSPPPGAAAGCRSLRDRSCWQAFSPSPAAAIPSPYLLSKNLAGRPSKRAARHLCLPEQLYSIPSACFHRGL